ncbi:condensation domain-containing protein [Streptomyces microflavus]|uniref:condensation domain-containing protein n=1 Tax=Streptomyces microflavus TaxID=1919 RepID=UPI00332913BA
MTCSEVPASELSLTWGQQAIWDAMKALGAYDHQFNLRWTLALPTPHPIPRVLAALEWIVDRHESLRTLYRGEDGVATQRLLERLDIPLHWRPVGTQRGETDRAAADLAEELCKRSFHHGDEAPLRVGLLHSDDEVTHVVLAISHMAADNDGLARVADELLGRLEASELALPPPAQPRQIAALQSTASWLARGERATGYWIETLRAAPPMEAPPRVADERSPRFWRGLLTSRPLLGAVGCLARTGGISTTSVLLAAVGSALGTLTGSRRPCVMLMCSNRTREPFRSTISPVALEGILSFDIGGEDGGQTEGANAASGFLAVARRAWDASLLAYRYAQYDKPALTRAIARADGFRSGMHRTCWFNDLRLERRPQEARPAVDDQQTGAFTWMDFTHEQGDAALAFHVYDHADTLQITLTADTRVVGPDAIEGVLRDVEQLIMDAAIAAATPGDMHV